jgi:hypothetical protein
MYQNHKYSKNPKSQDNKIMVLRAKGTSKKAARQ